MTRGPDPADRERIRRGELRGEALLAWLSERAPQARDQALEQLLGVDEYPLEPRAPGTDLTGYVPSGVSAIVRAVFEVPVRNDDVFVDLGAGLGKAAMLVHLLSGARAWGIELQSDLVGRAAAQASALGLTSVGFVEGDARDAPLDEGTVFFLYLPFTGPVLSDVLSRLRKVADQRNIVVCALGLDLRETEDWLTPRATDAFWLSTYDSKCAGAGPSPPRQPLPLPPVAATIANEQPQALSPRPA